MTDTTRPPAPPLAYLAPQGALEHFFAEEAQGYLRMIASFPPETPASEIRMIDGLLRSALRELRYLQHERLREEVARREQAA